MIRLIALGSLGRLMIKRLVMRLLLCNRRRLVNLSSILAILILRLFIYCLFSHFFISILFVRISFLVIGSIYIVGIYRVLTLLLCFLDSLFTIVRFLPHFTIFYKLFNHTQESSQMVKILFTMDYIFFHLLYF